MNWLDLLLNKYRLVRIAVLATATWMTVASLDWAYKFGLLWLETGKSGIEAAAVVAAITAPATGYAAWAFKVYVGSREND